MDSLSSRAGMGTVLRELHDEARDAVSCAPTIPGIAQVSLDGERRCPSPLLTPCPSCVDRVPVRPRRSRPRAIRYRFQVANSTVAPRDGATDEGESLSCLVTPKRATS